MSFLLRRIPGTFCCSMSLVPAPVDVGAEVEHVLARALETQLEAATGPSHKSISHIWRLFDATYHWIRFSAFTGALQATLFCFSA